MNTSWLTNLTVAAEGSTFWMPPQASTFAVEADAIYYFIYWLCVLSFVLLMAATALFAWKYRRKSEDQKTSPVKHNFRLEFLWSAIPTVLLVVVFAWSHEPFMVMSQQPSDALQVNVTGQTWAWTIEYPSLNKTCTDQLVVPVNEKVNLRLKSNDVIHSFWIPAFRLKKDVIPNRYSGYWFEATIPGEYPIYCAEYCGQGHSIMKGTVKVLTEDEWDAWTVSNAPEDCGLDLTQSIDIVGPILFQKHGCATCHGIEGQRIVGPPLNGIWGTEEQTDKGPVKVDANYIRESILEPGAYIVSGYKNEMSPYAGRIKPEELDKLVDYIQFLTEPEAFKTGGAEGQDGGEGAEKKTEPEQP